MTVDDDDIKYLAYGMKKKNRIEYCINLKYDVAFSIKKNPFLRLILLMHSWYHFYACECKF